MSFPRWHVCMTVATTAGTTDSGWSRQMSRLVLYMSMSLDGFIAGPGDTQDNPFGTNGHRLHAGWAPAARTWATSGRGRGPARPCSTR